jgi:hypothetical protein
MNERQSCKKQSCQCKTELLACMKERDAKKRPAKEERQSCQDSKPELFQSCQDRKIDLPNEIRVYIGYIKDKFASLTVSSLKPNQQSYLLSSFQTEIYPSVDEN